MKLWELTRSRGEAMPLQVVLTLLVTMGVVTLDINYWWLLITLVIVAVFNVCLVEAYLHRWCTHRSYELSKVAEYMLAFLACVVPGTGSTVGWVAIHSAHHRYSDTEKDPHSAMYTSFWKLLVWRYPYTGTLHSSRNLMGDRFHLSLHRYYFIYMAAWAGFWYSVLGIEGLYFIVLLPWAIGPLLSTIQNYFLHVKTIGTYRTFETSDNSQNSIPMHILSFGACGLHNNHHAFPNKPSTIVTPGEIDTAAMFISFISKK
jgi:fatty-acid desaturase